VTDLMRSIATGINAFAGVHLTAPRRKARIPISVELTYPKKAPGPSTLLRLEGHTRDISATGLGIILPLIRLSERLLHVGNGMLRIVINAAAGPINIYAVPVRYEPLYPGDQEIEMRCLLGVRFTGMSSVDRQRLTEYLRSLS
jgi:PilZ domain-containing protein